ncbi:MAG: DUF1924 domain-containing protein [Xanthomonadales bacterium]|nr:DUF1924 domain-containing protein [Xanthomonadales bacterium]MBK7146542.1 DUF1924 domain-containing protein [Xanthomonadales bacterium]MCC6563104.1 DUF1924 domain-containing protein [Xanthomonadales bacterium]
MLFAALGAQAETPAQLGDGYARQAGAKAKGDANRGMQLFTQRHGSDWSCSSCHGDRPVVPGRHASTGKTIAPLAPTANPQRFTDPAKVEKWFRRNCNDVLGRECSVLEKADVIAWLSSLKS